MEMRIGRLDKSDGLSVRGYLQLVRPPNLVTAAADILAGYAAAGLPDSRKLAFLVGSSILLYAGGVVLNDFFDRDLDAVERPERPIPSGRVRPGHAAFFGFLLLIAGVLAAAACSASSGLVAVAVACSALLYDSWAKPHALIGPLVMGLCRGLNLLLGLTAAPAIIGANWWLVALPITYIAAFTTMSAGEVQGGTRRSVLISGILFAAVFCAVLLLGLYPDFGRIWAVPVVLVLGIRVLPAIVRAYRDPAAAHVRAAVKAGVLSLIILDAAIAAGYAGPWFGAVVLVLLGLAASLARIFAVT